MRPRPMVVLSVRAYCSATPPWYAAAAVRTAVSRSKPASSAPSVSTPSSSR